jgi:hypothetical protein
MTTTPIVLLAPSPGMTFVAMPSGATYVADENGIVKITNGAIADQFALIAAGCATLEPNAGGAVATQTGTAYTVEAGDENNAIVFTNASPVSVTLPDNMAMGFAVSLFQGAAGQVTASAQSGGSVVTPNAATTPSQYAFLYCVVIANTTGASAQWLVVAQPSSGGGSGMVGASTLAGLYSQDTTAHYAQWSIAQVFSDGTPSNDGTWLKTGPGNGSGNWTQQATVTLQSLNAGVGLESTRATSIETFIQAKETVVTGIWPDQVSPFNIAFTDASGNVLDGSIYATGVRYTTNPNTLTTNSLWADETFGLYAITDLNGGVLEAQTTAGVTWPPPQLATADRTALNFLEFMAGAYLWADENYGIPFTDSTGGVVLGVRKDGSVDIAKLNISTSALTTADAQALSFFETTIVKIWDEIYSFVVTDPNNNVMLGVRRNGAVDVNLDSSGSGWLPVINANDGGIWAGNGTTQFKIATPQGATALPSPPQYSGALLEWLDPNISPWELRQYLFSGYSQVPFTITSLMHVPLYGESTSVGTDASVLYTTSPVSMTQAFMFNGGTRTVLGNNFNNSNINAKAPDSQQVFLIPLQEVVAPGETPIVDEGFGETQLSGCAYSILNIGSLVSTSAIVGSSHGMGGAQIGQLVKGSAQYKNLLRAVERAHALASQNGVTFSVPAILYVQGINDAGTSEGTWNTALGTLQANLTSDINAITGGSGQIPILIVQYACWTSTVSWSQPQAPPECEGMIDAYNANPTRILLIGNSYHIPYFSPTDGVHMVAQGYRMQGEELGRAISQLLSGGASSVNPPLFATAAAAHLTSLTVSFNNTTQLVIDTSIVSDPGQYGLRLTDNSGFPIALSSIAVSGTNEITATAASSLTAGGTYNLGIANYGTVGNSAGPTTGPRSCIRDNAAESYSAVSGGRMYRYACTQSIPVTVT